MLALITEIPRGVRKPSPKAPETRKETRFKMPAKAWLRQGEQSARVEVADLSSGGARVHSDSALSQNEPVLMRFYLKGAQQPLSVWGRVTRSLRRQDGQYEMGLQFSALPQRIARQLDGFLQRQSQKIQAELLQVQQQNQRGWFAQFGM